MARLVTVTCDFCGKVRDAAKGEMTLLTCTIEGKGGSVCDGHEVDACMTCKRKLIDIFNGVGDYKERKPFPNTDEPTPGPTRIEFGRPLSEQDVKDFAKVYSSGYCQGRADQECNSPFDPDNGFDETMRGQ